MSWWHEGLPEDEFEFCRGVEVGTKHGETRRPESVINRQKRWHESALMEVAKKDRKEHGVCQPQRLEGPQSVQSGIEEPKTNPEDAAQALARVRAQFEEGGVLEEEDEGYNHWDEESRLLVRLNRQNQGREYDRHNIDCNG